MKNRIVYFLLSALCSASFLAAPAVSMPVSAANTKTASAAVPAATYASELTGLPISTSLASQRPVAVMIDNDTRALPHYGLAEADVVYEMMNSTANNRVTRLMALYKDWHKVGQIGMRFLSMTADRFTTIRTSNRPEFRIFPVDFPG